MSTIEELQQRIKVLEQQLEQAKAEKDATPARQRIEQMSSEVVDTNPYRWLFNLFIGVFVCCIFADLP